MFAFHTLKRGREDESDAESDRYTKKSRPYSFPGFSNGTTTFTSPTHLVFRPSLPPSPPQAVPDLGSMTPGQSEQSAPNSPASLQEEQISHSSPRNADLDMDMDMDEDDFDTIRSQPPDSPFGTNFLRPAKLNFDSSYGRDSALNNTGRIPTPIYPTFNSHRSPADTSSMGGLGYPNSGFAGGMTVGSGHAYLRAPTNPILQRPPPPRNQSYVDQDRSHRMPSPISEDEDLPDTPTTLTQSQLSRLSVTTSSLPTEHIDLEGNGNSSLAPLPGVVTTPTPGRKRSGALSGKGRFSMGYRDDCEKCRQRVPGHYSHFLP